MRMKFLFGPRYETSVLDDVIKQYFDLMYHDHQFLDAVDCITQKQSYMQDGVYCFFPDWQSPEPEEHFEGVEFGLGYPLQDEDIVRIDEATCYRWVEAACKQYLNRHPQAYVQIAMFLARTHLQR